MTDVLVGVQVHAEAARLAQTLASLRDGGAPTFRLVLLPDGPDPATRAMLARMGIPIDGTAEARGSPACFNRLARRDRADVIVLLESGCTVGPGWLDALLAALRSRPAVGLAGPSTNFCWNQQAAFQGRGGTREDVIATAEEARRTFGLRTRSLAPLHGVGDFCMAVTRPVLDAVGAADESFGLGPCWEMEYCARALRAGFEAVWACGAYVHRAELTPRRRRMEHELFEASKRLYQDAVCGLRLSGERQGYATHCRGTECAHFAPPKQVRIHRPLRPTASRVGAPRLASCIMPTRDRADFVLHALDLLERQDHRHWELIIVDDGRDRLQDRLPCSERVRYVRAPAGESIGAKRNRACALARGEVIVHWDDDDWYAPARLRSQIEPLLSGQADITALRAGMILDLERWTYWRASAELHRRMFVHDVHGGTLAYRRTVWNATRFPDTSLAEDAGFLHTAVRRGARLRGLPNDDLFLYVRHAGSAWRFPCGSFLDERGWIRVREPKLPAADRQFLADRSPAAGRRSVALVSCVMPTANRRDMARRAIEYFARQDHPARELVVLDDGDDRIADLIPPDPRIRYFAGDRRLVLGAKRNVTCELSRGDVVLHWDDDDWAASHRIRYQLNELQRSGADVSGASSLLYLNPDGPRAWRYEHGGGLNARWVSGNTMCYERDAWRRGRFAEVPVGEDSRFIAEHPRRVHVVPDHRFIVGIIHARNASPKRTDNAWWSRVPVEEVTRLLGADAGAYMPHQPDTPRVRR